MKTPSQTVGPYYAIGLCRREENMLAQRDETGAFQLAGRLLDGQDAPVADGLVELWDGERFGRCGTAPEGRFSFVVTKPGGEAPHFDVWVHARGLLRQQLTRIYFPDEDNERDPVYAGLAEEARRTLVAVHEEGGMRFDIRMQGTGATVFFEH